MEFIQLKVGQIIRTKKVDFELFQIISFTPKRVKVFRLDYGINKKNWFISPDSISEIMTDSEIKEFYRKRKEGLER
jgi:hypothetical protein